MTWMRTENCIRNAFTILCKTISSLSLQSIEQCSVAVSRNCFLALDRWIWQFLFFVVLCWKRSKCCVNSKMNSWLNVSHLLILRQNIQIANALTEGMNSFTLVGFRVRFAPMRSSERGNFIRFGSLLKTGCDCIKIRCTISHDDIRNAIRSNAMDAQKSI